MWSTINGRYSTINTYKKLWIHFNTYPTGWYLHRALQWDRPHRHFRFSKLYFIHGGFSWQNRIEIGRIAMHATKELNAIKLCILKSTVFWWIWLWKKPHRVKFNWFWFLYGIRFPFGHPVQVKISGIQLIASWIHNWAEHTFCSWSCECIRLLILWKLLCVAFE